jgi:hypothetical protein
MRNETVFTPAAQLSPANRPASGPQVLDSSLLALVAGGLPRGGWSAATSQEALPRGGWQTEAASASLLPRGGW